MKKSTLSQRLTTGIYCHISRLIALIITATLPNLGTAQNRFPKPDFESGYEYPTHQFVTPNEQFWNAMDIVILILLMSIVAWAVLKKRVRRPVIGVSIFSVLYFGFFREGCVCSIGSIQNIALALTDQSYAIPLTVLLIFLLPIIFTILFGRVFCAGVCPFGALQELVNIKNYKLSKALTTVLGLIPWIYLSYTVMFAVTHSGFIICQFDPFIGIFRRGGDTALIIFGVLLLVASLFTGRPFCRFICPYGALLSLFARVSIWRVKITRQECINCELCHNACPVDAIRPPYDNKVMEQRSAGVRRILIYFVGLPAMAIIGALLMRSLSDTFSKANKEVRLYEMVILNEIQPQDIQSLELQSFYGQGGTIEKLAPRVETIKSEFLTASTIAGSFIGVFIGFTLIGLSLKRTRRKYEIDDAGCVDCGRCFNYCPQNKISSFKHIESV